MRCEICCESKPTDSIATNHKLCKISTSGSECWTVELNALWFFVGQFNSGKDVTGSTTWKCHPFECNFTINFHHFRLCTIIKRFLLLADLMVMYNDRKANRKWRKLLYKLVTWHIRQKFEARKRREESASKMLNKTWKSDVVTFLLLFNKNQRQQRKKQLQ